MCLLSLTVMVILPLLIPAGYILSGSDETARTMGGVLDEGRGYASFVLLNAYPDFTPLKDLLLYCEAFYRSFWNSVLYAGGITAVQLLFGTPAAWALGQYTFRGKRLVYLFYIFMMMLPFQVTMVSEYMLFYRAKAADTVWTVLLPGMFSAFPVFLMADAFGMVPKEITEAARMEGAGEFRIFLELGVPLGKSGMAAAWILNFIEYWNMVEQPLAFLQNDTLKPLSLFLPEWNAYTAGSIFAASIAAMIVPILVFIQGKTYLEEGISCLAVKK